MSKKNGVSKKTGILSTLIYLGLCGVSYADTTFTDSDFPYNGSISTSALGNVTINTTNAINPVLTAPSGTPAINAGNANTLTINNDNEFKIIGQNTSSVMMATSTSNIRANGDILIDFQSAGSSRGVYATSNSNIDFYKNLTITSTSNNAIGMMLYSSGSIAMKDNASTLTINLAGDGAYGIVGQTEQPAANLSFVSDAKVDINLTGNSTTGISTQYLQQGAATLTFNNDVSVITDHGEALRSELANGIFNFNAKSTFISKDALTYNAIVNLEGTINIAGETEIQGDMLLSGATSNTNIDAKMTSVGNIDIADQSNLTINAKSGSLIKAAINSDATAQTSLTLANDAQWSVTGNSTFQTLNNQGNVAFIDNGGGTFTTLTVDTLSGNGTFIMNADIAGQNSDKIIAANTSGAHMVTVVNNGSASTNGTERFDMIETGDGKATFTGTNKVELGGYEYQFGRSTTNANNWGVYGGTVPEPIIPDPKPEIPGEDKPETVIPGVDKPVTVIPNNPGTGKITTTANAAASFASAGYLMNYVDTQMLMTRMGELRNNSKTTQGNVWVRGLGGKINAFSVGKISGFDMSYGGAQFGADKAFDITNGVIYGGAAFSYISGNPDYWGGDGNFKSYQASLYATYIADNGYYIDGIAKYIHQKNQFDVRDSAGYKVNGSASSDGWGLSVEAGKRITLSDKRFYIEPQAQLSYSSIGSNNTQASNGLRVKIDETESLLGRIGGTIGYALAHENNPTYLYAKAYYVHEFKGDVDYRLNGNREGHSFEGDWGDFSVGLNSQISKQHNIFTEIHYATGNKFDNTRFNAGYRFQF